VLRLKSPYRDATTPIVMSPLEFMQRLAALVLRPRLHPATWQLFTNNPTRLTAQRHRDTVSLPEVGISIFCVPIKSSTGTLSASLRPPTKL